MIRVRTPDIVERTLEEGFHMPPTVFVTRPPGRNPFYAIKIRGHKWHLGVDPVVAHERAAKLLAGQLPGEAVYVAQLLVAWRGAHPECRHVEYGVAWDRFAGDDRVTTLTTDHLVRYADWLGAVCIPGTDRHYAPETIGKYYRFALRCLEWAVAQGTLAELPDKPQRIPTRVKKPRDLDPGNLEAAFKSLPPRIKRLVAFMLATGCRPGEARTLQWADVDFRRKVCVVTGKTAHRTGMTRTIALPPDALGVLRDAPRECDWVFPSSRMKPYTRHGLKAMMRRCGIPSAYAIRHTFAQHILDAGVAIEDVAAILGHTNLRTVLTYTQVRPARLSRVAATLTSPVPLQPAPTPQASSRATKDA